MEMRRGARLVAALALAVAALAPRPAAAFGHLWDISEIYSNADGTVQFIEMASDVAGENSLSQLFLRSTGTGQEFHFPNDLAGSTMNRHLLVATAGFASQPGAVTPDYVMPDGFIRVQGDTLSFWSEGGGAPPYGTPPVQWDTYTFGAGALPTDGTSSIQRDHGTITTGTNSPTNFAGQSGSLTAVPEPASAWLLGSGLAALALARRRALAASRA